MGSVTSPTLEAMILVERAASKPCVVQSLLSGGVWQIYLIAASTPRHFGPGTIEEQPCHDCKKCVLWPLRQISGTAFHQRSPQTQATEGPLSGPLRAPEANHGGIRFRRIP